MRYRQGKTPQPSWRAACGRVGSLGLQKKGGEREEKRNKTQASLRGRSCEFKRSPRLGGKHAGSGSSGDRCRRMGTGMRQPPTIPAKLLEAQGVELEHLELGRGSGTR